MKTTALCPLAGILMATSPLLADQHRTDIQQSLYACERGVTVAATYINTSGGESFVVVNAEGHQTVLSTVMSASGAKYAHWLGPVRYVWWTKDDTASLYVEESGDDDKLTLLNACTTISE